MSPQNLNKHLYTDRQSVIKLFFLISVARSCSPASKNAISRKIVNDSPHSQTRRFSSPGHAGEFRLDPKQGENKAKPDLEMEEDVEGVGDDVVADGREKGMSIAIFDEPFFVLG